MLVDVSEVSTEAEVLGARLSMPVAVAPVAFQRLAHPDGEPAMARAAAAAGTAMSLSTLATATPTEVAEAAPGATRWMQLYCFRDRGVTRALLDEAVAAGYEAILLTVDAPFAGRRERDFRTGFEIPADVRTPAIEAAVGRTDLTVAEVFGLVDPALGWDDLEQLASECELPVLVKGLVTSEDAALAVEHGAGGVVVSNHGGRQLDAAPATIDALPEVVDAVEGRIPVLMDGGHQAGHRRRGGAGARRGRGARRPGVPLGAGGRRTGRSRARPRDAPRRAAAHPGAARLRVAGGADDRARAPPGPQDLSEGQGTMKTGAPSGTRANSETISRSLARRQPVELPLPRPSGCRGSRSCRRRSSPAAGSAGGRSARGRSSRSSAGSPGPRGRR